MQISEDQISPNFLKRVQCCAKKNVAACAADDDKDWLV
jgi:hypothetical protein